MGNGISADSHVVVRKEHLSCDLAGEAVILDLKSGVYYGLDPVGARIWSLIQDGKAVREVLGTLLGEYEVEPDRCAQDLERLLQDLAARGLVEIHPAVKP